MVPENSGVYALPKWGRAVLDPYRGETVPWAATGYLLGAGGGKRLSMDFRRSFISWINCSRWLRR